MSMARAIESMGLEGVWDLKPMFNGGEVKKILPRIPRGPAFSDVMDVSGKNGRIVNVLLHGVSCHRRFEHVKSFFLGGAFRRSEHGSLSEM